MGYSGLWTITFLNLCACQISSILEIWEESRYFNRSAIDSPGSRICFNKSSKRLSASIKASRKLASSFLFKRDKIFCQDLFNCLLGKALVNKKLLTILNNLSINCSFIIKSAIKPPKTTDKKPASHLRLAINPVVSISAKYIDKGS